MYRVTFRGKNPSKYYSILSEEKENIPYFAMYNVHPHFCAHCTWDYYTIIIHDMQSLYPRIIHILTFPSETGAKN